MSRDASGAAAEGAAAEEGNPLASALATVDDRLQAIDWYPLVKKEFADTIRTRAIVVLSVLYVTMFVLPIALLLYTDLGEIAQVATVILQSMSLRVLSVVVPISAIALAYAAVSGEHQRGSLKILMSLPYSRGDVIVGKLFGRFLAVATPLAAALVLQTIVVLPDAGGDMDFRVVGVLIGLSLLLTLTFTGFSLGASASTSTTKRSLIVAGGIWVYMFALWNTVSQGVANLLRDHATMEEATILKVELFVKLINPTQAYQSLVISWGSAETTVADARASMFGSLISGESGLLRQQMATNVLSDSVPWYLTDASAVALMVLWCVVPVYLGYRLFDAADL